MNKPSKPQSSTKHRLQDVHEGQVMRLADMTFTVLSKERRGNLVHLDLEANDGSHVTFIGVTGARISLREGTRDPFPMADNRRPIFPNQ